MRKSIEIFIQEGMEVKLIPQDEIKVPWEFQSITELFAHLKEERKEVVEAFNKWRSTGCAIDQKALMLELADEANLCMMLFSNLHEVSRHYRRGDPEPRLPRMTQMPLPFKEFDCETSEYVDKAGQHHYSMKTKVEPGEPVKLAEKRTIVWPLVEDS